MTDRLITEFTTFWFLCFFKTFAKAGFFVFVLMLPKVWSCPQMKNIPSYALCVNFELNPSVVIGIISLSLLSALLVVYSLSVLSLNHVWQPLWQSTNFRAYCDIQPPYRKEVSSYYMNCFLMRQFLSVNNF